MIIHISLANSSKTKLLDVYCNKRCFIECFNWMQYFSYKHHQKDTIIFLHLMNDKTEVKWNDIDFVASWA